MSNTKNKDKSEKCLKKKKPGFTLVELIVVITILAILGTIAFISFQNYTKNSRDGVRIADINSIKKNLELFITDKGFYPLPDNGTPIIYSGATVWIQGTIGDNVITNLGRINKKPTDPLTNSEYTYSLTNAKTEYQLASINEGGLSYNIPLTNQTYAATTKTAIAMVTGTYNEKILKVSTGSNYYILAIPSIVNVNLSDTNLQSIIDNKELVYNKYSNIPDSYKNKGFTMTGGFDFVPGGDIVVYSGSTSTTLSTNEAKRIFLDNLKKVYNGSLIQSEAVYTEVLSADTTNINSTAVALVDTFINNNVGGITGTPTPIIYGCAVQPSYSGAIFTAGTPTLVNQTWQGTGSTLPCYYTCGDGKVLIGEECIANSCTTQPSYTHATFTGGTPTQINQSRQNSNSGNPCYYACIDGYTGNDCSVAPEPTYTISNCPTVNSARNGTTPTKATILANINNYIGCDVSGKTGKIAGYSYSGSVSDSNKMVLMAATSDETTMYPWGTNYYDVTTLNNTTGLTNTGLIEMWDGYNNSQKILAKLIELGETNKAAQKCNSKGIGWYLPSIEEMTELYCYSTYGDNTYADCANKGYANINKGSLLNFTTVNYYHASNESGTTTNWYIRFSDGYRLGEAKINNGSIRCVNRF